MNSEQLKVHRLDRRAMHADRLRHVLGRIAEEASAVRVVLHEVDGWSDRVAVTAGVDGSVRVLEAEPDTSDMDGPWTVSDQDGVAVCTVSVRDADDEFVASALATYLRTPLSAVRSAAVPLSA